MVPLQAVDLRVLRVISRIEADGPMSVRRLAAATGLEHDQVVVSVDALRQHGLVDVTRADTEGEEWMAVRLRDEARRVLHQQTDGEDL